MKRLIPPLRCVIICCLAFYLSEGMGNAESKQESLNGPTVIEKALEQADDVSNRANRAVVLAQIAKTYLKNGHHDEALTVAETILDPCSRALLFIELTRLSAEKGQSGKGAVFVKKAMADIKRISNPDQQVFAWLKCAETCGDIPGLKGTGLTALDLASNQVDKIKDTQLRAGRMVTLAERNKAYGRTSEAMGLLDDALETSKEKDDAHENITVLDHVALGYLRAGNTQKASEVVADIEDLYTVTAAYDRMADYYASIGQFNKAAEKAAAIERSYTRAFTLSRLAVLKQQAGISGAGDLLKRAWMDAINVKDDFLKSSAMAQVAESRSAIGQVEAAQILAEKIPHKVVRALTLNKVAAGFAKGSQYDRALAVADGISHPYYKTSTLNRLAEIARVGLGGNHEDAKKWLNRAEKISAEIEDVYLQQTARVSIVDGFAGLGAFDQAVKLAELIEDRYHFATALYHVTHQYALQKQYAEAMRMAAAIDDPYYRASALTEIAAALYENGSIAFEKDSRPKSLAFANQNNKLKQIGYETDVAPVSQVTNVMMNTSGSGLISFAVAESDTGPFFPQGGTLIANRSFPKKKNVLRMGEDVEMKEAMDDVFKVFNTLMNDPEIDTQGKQQQFLVYLNSTRYDVQNVRYDTPNRNNFWVNDFQGKNLEDPYLPELKGKDLSDLPDANGNEPFLLFKRVGVKKGQGIVSHMWPKSELKNKSYPRISLVRILEQWGWDVVTSYTPKTIEDYELYDTVIKDRVSGSPI